MQFLPGAISPRVGITNSSLRARRGSCSSIYVAKDESRKEVAPDRAKALSRFCCGVEVEAVMVTLEQEVANEAECDGMRLRRGGRGGRRG